MIGSCAGCIPAAVCGVLIARERLTRSWKSSLMAAAYGSVIGIAAGTLVGLMVMSLITLPVFAAAGGLSAAILSAIVLPKAK
ncbi:hypothetical protein [Kingella potus]|uniref:hypothetical protein n=1 Tax=Kingella potus TaxID=265175 RepID=UPI000E1BE039|nr:hypothetical protein [Kingella potus]UOP01434.1 hypothetical protein LVJ84_04295 [Kingella potus]